MFAIGIDIGGTNSRLGLVDESGNLCEIKEIHTDITQPPEIFLDQLTEAMTPFLKKASAIGIGVAGQVENGFLHFAPNLNWKNIPLAKTLSSRVKLPVIVENDVRAALYAEWTCGAGKNYHDLVMLSLGTGLGGAIISGGNLIRGDRSAAGEFGHLCVDFKGRKCTCGGQGCLEAYVGGWAIRQQAGGISPEEVFKKGAAGDPLCKQILLEVNQALAAGVVSLLSALNPKCIIYAGGIFDAHPELINNVKPLVKNRGLPIDTEKLEWKPAKLQYPGVIGSALQAINFH